MKKQDVLAIVELLPDEFDTDQLLGALSLQHMLERAKADFAAGRRTPDAERERLPGTDRSSWESERARYERRERVLMRMLSNRELMEQVYDGIEQIKRGERGTPLRDLQKRRQAG